MRPLVSILVACHNYERYLGECIESVLQQTYEHFEMIICDDGSTDQSIEVISSYLQKDSRLRLIQQPNQGMAAALNRCWTASRGEVICLLDADDTFFSDKLASILAAFRTHPKAGFVIHRAIRTDAFGHQQGVLPLLRPPSSGWCADEMLENGGILLNVPPTSNLSLRREIAEKIFPIPEEFWGFAERVIQRLAPLMTEVYSLDRALATWRLHGANDANADRLSAAQIARDVENMQQLWHLQWSYLNDIEPELARTFRSLHFSLYYCRLAYMLSRLRSAPEAQQFHRDLVNCPGFVDRPLLERWFWRVAPYLPIATLQRANNLLMTQGWTKQMVSRWLHVGRTRSSS